MTSISEQSCGFLALLALAFFVGAVVEIKLPESQPVCISVIGYEYQGRDENGRPSWEYPKGVKCYENR